jgi:hypothetical protein
MDSQDLHRKSPRLQTVSASAITSKRLINVLPDNRRTYRDVITVAGFLVLGVAASKRRVIVARPSLYLRAPSSITASSTAYGSTTQHRNYGTVD